MSVVGKRIREARLVRGLTGVQLAAQAGLDPSSLSMIETGKRDPSVGSLLRLASELEFEPAILLPTLSEIKNGS